MLKIVVVIAAVVCTGMTRIEAEQSMLIASRVEFVQITSMRLNDGQQTFEAFRILSSGLVEWARWDSSGHLLDHAEPHDAGKEIFDRVVSSPSFLNPPKPPQDDGSLGRPGFRLEIAFLSGAGYEAVAMNKMPDDIAALTEEIRRGLKPKPVQTGWYLWTQPYPPQTGNADIDIAEAKCDSAIAMALKESIKTGRLIVRADERIKLFISGERAHRHAFIARLTRDNLLFGVLSSK